jgi:hypothetical protein
VKHFSGPYYVYPDKPDAKQAAGIKSMANLSSADAKVFNDRQFAVAAYVNDLAGGRSNDSCVAIRAWFVDIDYKHGKATLDDLLDYSPLIPSSVVETYSGYHLYWKALDAGVNDHYIKQQRAIVDHFDGDVKCVSFGRGLRSPGFYHHKYVDPFLVQVVFSADVEYKSAQIDFAFVADEEEEPEEVAAVKKLYKELPADNTYSRIFNYDSREMLSILCSTGVIPKRYTFKRTNKGHYNIIVDGKDSGCFINKDDVIIGNPRRYSGGPVEWLDFYGLKREQAARKICEVMGWEYKL